MADVNPNQTQDLPMDYESVQSRKKEERAITQSERSAQLEADLVSQGYSIGGRKEALTEGDILGQKGYTPTPETPTPETPTPETPTPEAPTPETPAPETKTGTPKKEDSTQISDIATFKQQGGGMNELQELIETRYGTTASIEGDTIISDINGERFQWKIDKGGNPIKTSLGFIDNKYSNFGKESGIKTVFKNGKTYFDPQSLEEAIDIYSQFGRDVPLTKQSVETIKASKSYEYFSQYKGASSDVIFEGMKSGQIGTGGETWEMLSKMNGGQPTLEMIDAQKKFEEYTKISNVNGENKVIFDIFEGKEPTIESVSDKVTSQITARDAEYQKAIEEVFASTDLSFSEFKSQNESLTRLNTEVNNIASDIDKLNTDKRKIWDEIEKEFPGITRSSAIDIYNQRVDAIDDQLYVLQRDFNNKSSSLNYQESLAQSEYEYKLQRAENQYNMITTMYGIQRGELVDQRAIARADEKLKEERAYLEEQRKQAIIDGDAEKAKAMEYELVMFEEKTKIQQKFTDYQFTTPSSGVIAKMNPATGEIEFIEAPSIQTSNTQTPGPSITGKNTGDLRGLASQFPGQAWAKNNNPAGITWNANFDNPTPGSTAQRLIDAGINFSKGTPRPASEGGNYVTFDTIEDGLAAQRIMMSGTYGNSTVGSMLQSWVGTSEGPSYAKQVAGNAGIDLGVKVSDLSDMELQQLQLSKIQKESPGLYDLLTTKEATEFTPEQELTLSAYKGTDIKKLAENLGTNEQGAREMLNSYIEDNNSFTAPLEYRQAIYQQVPATLKNSDAELKNLYKQADNYYNKGYSEVESVWAFNGVPVDQIKSDETKYSIANAIHQSYIRMLPEDSDNMTLTTMLQQVVKGNYDTAYETLETLGDNRLKDIYGDNAVTSLYGDVVLGKINEAKDIITKLNNKTPISGTLESWLGKFKDSEYAYLAGKLERLYGPERLKYFGSATTSGESSLMGNWQPDIKDSAANAKALLDVFEEDILRSLNTQRGRIGLNPIESGKTSLEDRVETFKNLYSGSYNNTQKPIQTQTTSTFDKLKQGIQGSSNDYESLIP